MRHDATLDLKDAKLAYLMRKRAVALNFDGTH